MQHEERLAAALLAAANDWQDLMGKNVFLSFLDFLQDKADARRLGCFTKFEAKVSELTDQSRKGKNSNANMDRHSR